MYFTPKPFTTLCSLLNQFLVDIIYGLPDWLYVTFVEVQADHILEAGVQLEGAYFVEFTVIINCELSFWR